MSWFKDFIDKAADDVRDVVRQADITDPNSGIRGGLRAIDFTNPSSAIRSGLRAIDPTDQNSSLRQTLRNLDPTNALESIAFPLAQAWKNDHPNAVGSEDDYKDCMIVVAAGAAATGAAMGGVPGAAIGAGGGMAVAGLVCRRVLS